MLEIEETSDEHNAEPSSGSRFSKKTQIYLPLTHLSSYEPTTGVQHNDWETVPFPSSYLVVNQDRMRWWQEYLGETKKSGLG